MANRITRRQMLYLATSAAVAATVGGAFFAFSANRPNPTQPAQAPQPSATSPVSQSQKKLVILARSAYHEEIHKRGLIPYFRSKVGPVEVQYVPKGYDETYQVGVLAMQRQSGEYDVLYVDEPWLLDFKPHVEVIEGVDASGYPSKLVEKQRVGNGLFAVPIVGNVNFFFYRHDLLDQMNESPPRSMDDLARLLEEASRKLPRGVYAAGANLPSAVSDAYATILLAHGGALFDPKDGVTPVVDSQEGVEALKTLYLFKKHGHPKNMSWTNLTEYSEAIYQGEIMSGMVWNGWVQYADVPERSKIVGKMEVMPLPGKRGAVAQTGVWYYVVPKYSQNKELAKEYVRLATSFEGQLYAHLNAQMPPTRYTVYQDSKAREMNRLADSYLKLLEAATPARTSPAYMDAESALNTTVSKYLNDQITAEEAVRQMQKILVEASKKRGLI